MPRVVDALLGSRQLFVDRRLAAEKSPGNLGGAETAQHFSKARMTERPAHRG